jgi:hypothetical protein
MGWLSGVALVVLLVVAFILRGSAYGLSVVTAAIGVSLTAVYTAITSLDRTTLGAVTKASTLYRRAAIRVSIAYLIAIQLDDEYLLVRGGRITTQFQPVGGVFKTDLQPHDLYSRFRAEPDTRFTPDSESTADLRLRLPGGQLNKLLQWFRTGRDREVLPIRELYDELVCTGLLAPEPSRYVDCCRIGTRSFPLRHDRWAGCQQLILAEVWALRPTAEQTVALRQLRDAKPRSGEVYFASRKEILGGSQQGVAKSTFDISPTAVWLLEDPG